MFEVLEKATDHCGQVNYMGGLNALEVLQGGIPVPKQVDEINAELH